MTGLKDINPVHIAKAVMGILALVLGKMGEGVEKDENGNPIIKDPASLSRRDPRYPPGPPGATRGGYVPYPPPGPYPYGYGPPPHGYPGHHAHAAHPHYAPPHRTNTYPINPYMVPAENYPGSYPGAHRGTPPSGRRRKRSKRHQHPPYDPNQPHPAFPDLDTPLNNDLMAEEILVGDDAHAFRERTSAGSLHHTTTT